jgi:DNA invertase Pin-like site-specific DNA recombinase
MRAAIYTRISERDERVDKVDLQERSCRAFAKKHNYSVVQVYVDDGISAYTGKQRPDYLQMLRDAEARKFDVIVATFEDRLSRRPEEKLALAGVCRDNGITWHTVHDGRIDPADPDDKLFAFLRGWVGEKEQTQKIKRLRERFAERQSQGLPLWGVRPFGFELDRMTHRQDEADEIRWACEHILAGGKVHAVVKAWNERGITSTRGNPWSHISVKQLLKRPRNAGLMEADGMPIEEPPAQWDPIVDRETWDQVVAILSAPRGEGPIDREPKWLCSGLVYCAVCGDVLRPSTGRDRKQSFKVYRCSRSSRLAKSDGRAHVSIKCSELDGLVRAAVASAFMFGPTAEMSEASGDVAEIRRLEKRLREIRRAQEDVTALVGARGMNRMKLAMKAGALADEEEQVVGALELFKQQSAHAAMLMTSRTALFQRGGEGRRLSLAKAADLKKDLIERFESLPLDQRRTLVRSLLRVTVLPGLRIDDGGARRRTCASERVDIAYLTVASLAEEDQQVGAMARQGAPAIVGLAVGGDSAASA